MAATPVTAVPLTEIVIEPEASAPASVRALAESTVSAELSATLSELPVKAGDAAAAGGVLARLDCADYDLGAEELQARLDTVKARLTFARQQLERARKLQQNRTIAEELVEQRQSELASLNAELAATQVQLAVTERKREKCTVRAPFAGVVLERLADVGEYLTPGTPLLTLLDTAAVEVSAAVGLDDLPGLQNAAGPIFRHNGQDYPLRLRTLLPRVDGASRTREARLTFSAEPALAGASGRLVWSRGSAVPATLLVERDGRLGVFLAINGRATFQPLPDAQEGRPAAVDLAPQTMIVTDGRLGLHDGDPIYLSNP